MSYPIKYTKEEIDIGCIQDRLKTLAITSEKCGSQHVEQTIKPKKLGNPQHSGNNAPIWTYNSSRIFTSHENAKIGSMKPISWASINPTDMSGKQTESNDTEVMLRMEHSRTTKLCSGGFPGEHLDNYLCIASKRKTAMQKSIHTKFPESFENSCSKGLHSNSSSDDSIDEKIIKMKAKKGTTYGTSEQKIFKAISWEPKIHEFSINLDDIANSKRYSKDSMECTSEISKDSSSVASCISYFIGLKYFNDSSSASDKNSVRNEQIEDNLASVGSYEEFEALLLCRPSDSMSKIRTHEP